MKSFKVPMLFTLAAALSCGANGSPATGATTDGHFIERQYFQRELTAVVNSISDVARMAYIKVNGKSNRAEFNKAVVKQLAANNAHYNYVISAVSHEYKFDGTEGVDWGHSWLTNLDGIDYDILVGKAGFFTLQEAHEYKNWAWDGVLAPNQNPQSKTIYFVNPVTPGGPTRSSGGG